MERQNVPFYQQTFKCVQNSLGKFDLQNSSNLKIFTEFAILLLPSTESLTTVLNVTFERP